MLTKVRHGPKDVVPSLRAPPFTISGARNIMLETIKRGEDDDASYRSEDKQTVILRLYEQFGGHAKATLKMWVFSHQYQHPTV